MPSILCSLRQQPIAECHDLGQPCGRLWTHDPIGVGYRQCLPKRPYQPPANEVPGGERSPCERDTLAVHCRINGHAGLVEHRPARDVDVRDPCGIEPSAPILPVIDVKQDGLFQVIGSEALPAVQQLRAADGEEFLRT